MSNKRRIRDEDDDVILMPPPSTIPSTAKPVLYYPEDNGHPPTRVLAPPSSPRSRHGSRALAFGRSSTRRQSAVDNIGYVPENIPTPRITRPRSVTTGGTSTGTGPGKRRRGLKISAVATTSPVRPARPIQPAPSPSKHSRPSSKRSDDGDDDEYIVDSSDDEGPVRFNLPSEDAPRSSKVARTDTSARPQPTPSTKRRSIGNTPGRRSKLAIQAGTTPARPATSSALPGDTGAGISSTPIPLNLPQTRPVFRPSLPAAEASPFVSSSSHARVVSQPTAGPSRISQLSRAEAGPSTAGTRRVSSSGVSRPFSTAGARNVPLLAQPPPSSAGTKRAPGSKSKSPPGAKRPRVATPSPPVADDIIILSSSDDDVEEPGARRSAEQRRPSPSPSLGGYRPTPPHSGRSRAGSRAGSGSASSDVVLLDGPPKKPARREPPSHESPQAIPAPDPLRVPTPPLAGPSRQPSTPKDAPRPQPPSTPSPSRHSSSSEMHPKPAKRPLKKVQSIESIQPVIGRRITTGRRQRIRREIQNAEPEPSPSPEEISSSHSSSKQGEATTLRPVASSSRQPQNPSQPTKSAPFRHTGGFSKPPDPGPSQRVESPSRTTRSPSPPWTGKPLFRPPTTAASGLTPFRELSPRTASVRPTPGPSRLHEVESAEPEPTKRPQIDTSRSAVAKRTGLFEDDDDDPLSSLYDEPSRPTIAGASIFGPPQNLVAPRARPSESPGPSTIFSFNISSAPPPTVLSASVAPRRRPLRLDCVLLPRASKSIRRALERSKKSSLAIKIPKKLDKGKGKARDDSPSEFPSPETSSASQAGSSSTAGPQPPPQPPVVRYLVIDPQLSDISHYPSLPPEILESPDRYCHCCRTRGRHDKVKMRCNSMTHRRRPRFPNPHECGTYWCQRCLAKHDIVFNPMLEHFRCPLCNGVCECDKCLRDRGLDPLGRVHKVVKVKPGKRTLDAFKKGRVASGSISSATIESNTTAEPAGPSRTSKTPEPDSSSVELEPESESSNTPPATGPAPTRASASGPTIWHGSRPPPHLRLRLASGHVLSSSAHIFVKRGPTAEDVADSVVESTVDQPDETEPAPEEEQPVEEERPAGEEPPVEEEPWGSRHEVFEGDYSASGNVSFLGADSGTFELEIEHGPSDVDAGGPSPGAHDMEVEPGPVGRSASLGAEGGTGESVIASDTAHSTTEGEGETSVTSTVTDDTSRASTETPIGGTLAYPPSESSEGSQPDVPVVTHTAPVESSTHTITGTLDDHTPSRVLVDTPAASTDTPSDISNDTLVRIFHESVQGFSESENPFTERDFGSASSSRQYSDTGELQSVTPEAGEPQPTTPDLDEIRAALGLGDTFSNPELTTDLGQLHTEGTFETVPRISMGDGGDLTLIGSLRDISLFNAVMDCSDEKHDIALSSSQTERLPTVCGSLLDQSPPSSPIYPFDLEPLAIPELEDFESEPEHEPDLVHATDPESTKSTILETPSPQLEHDTGSDLTDLPDLFDDSSDHESRATSFVFPTKAKRVRTRNILQSQFTQQTKPASRTTRSQTRKSMMERSKFLRSSRCYGVTS